MKEGKHKRSEQLRDNAHSLWMTGFPKQKYVFTCMILDTLYGSKLSDLESPTLPKSKLATSDSGVCLLFNHCLPLTESLTVLTQLRMNSVQENTILISPE